MHVKLGMRYCFLNFLYFLFHVSNFVFVHYANKLYGLLDCIMQTDHKIEKEIYFIGILGTEQKNSKSILNPTFRKQNEVQKMNEYRRSVDHG